MGALQRPAQPEPGRHEYDVAHEVVDQLHGSSIRSRPTPRRANGSNHMTVPPHLRAGVVLPIRGFVDGKTRLAPRLDAARRRDLVEDLAGRAVRAARLDDLALCIVSSASDVVAWATRLLVPVIADPGSLDGAGDAGRAWAIEAGFDRVIVAHADLPLVTSFAALLVDDDRTIAFAPCRHDDGTNAISLPVNAEFTFRYGPGSFVRHLDEARRSGHPVVVVRDDTLAFDIDEPADLDELARVDR